MFHVANRITPPPPPAWPASRRFAGAAASTTCCGRCRLLGRCLLRRCLLRRLPAWPVPSSPWPSWPVPSWSPSRPLGSEPARPPPQPWRLAGLGAAALGGSGDVAGVGGACFATRLRGAFGAGGASCGGSATTTSDGAAGACFAARLRDVFGAGAVTASASSSSTGVATMSVVSATFGIARSTLRRAGAKLVTTRVAASPSRNSSRALRGGGSPIRRSGHVTTQLADAHVGAVRRVRLDHAVDAAADRVVLDEVEERQQVVDRAAGRRRRRTRAVAVSSVITCAAAPSGWRPSRVRLAPGGGAVGTGIGSDASGLAGAARPATHGHRRATTSSPCG